MREVIKTLAKRVGVYPAASAAYRAARGSKLVRGVEDLLVQSRYGHIDRFDVRVNGVSAGFSTTDDFSLRWFFPRYAGGKLHEPHVTPLLLREIEKARCFVDVGALLGYYTCLASKIIPSGVVYAFEMDAYNFGLLEKNIALNGATNVRAMQAAVADRSGTLSYFRNGTGEGGVFKLAKLGTTFTQEQLTPAKAVTLDEVFATEAGPDVVKVDVEGAEILVLKGMLGLLRERKPTLFMEVHPNTIQGFGATSQDLVRIITECGYELYAIENRDDRGYLTRVGDTVAHNTMLYAVPAGRAVTEGFV
jgi:FkbM family methyltransferase